jgi:hypothetical protein
MERQPDLLQPDLKVRPREGASGPRLWVKRLAVWREPGGELIRDIALRPGLNIIWSPDGADSLARGAADGAMGHGSRKTLFCRLLRYCLGEDRFAPEHQREQIGTCCRAYSAVPSSADCITNKGGFDLRQAPAT